MRQTEGIVWVRSLLSVYRQAAVEAARPEIDPAARGELLDALGQVHALFTPHEDLPALWRDGFGGSENGIREALSPLVSAAARCNSESPMRALAEFAAEEIAFLFDAE